MIKSLAMIFYEADLILDDNKKGTKPAQDITSMPLGKPRVGRSVPDKSLYSNKNDVNTEINNLNNKNKYSISKNDNNDDLLATNNISWNNLNRVTENVININELKNNFELLNQNYDDRKINLIKIK